MADKITVKDSRGVAFTETYPIAIKKDITGDEDQAFEHGKSSSKAVKVYLRFAGPPIAAVLDGLALLTPLTIRKG